MTDRAIGGIHGADDIEIVGHDKIVVAIHMIRSTLTITHIFAGRLMRPGLDTEWRKW
jgi:hypothetical protein